MNIAYGLCQCGCGLLAPIATQNNKKRRWIKGYPLKFIDGHQNRLKDYCGEKHPKWNGGKFHRTDGYIVVWDPKHPRAITQKYIMEHILIIERVIGKPFPDKCEIHHVNMDRSDNKNTNLVACEDIKYHRLLHLRTRAYKACGHANWRKCNICKKWDDPVNLSISGNTVYHLTCHRRYRKLRYRILTDKANAGK